MMTQTYIYKLSNEIMTGVRNHACEHIYFIRVLCRFYGDKGRNMIIININLSVHKHVTCLCTDNFTTILPRILYFSEQISSIWTVQTDKSMYGILKLFFGSSDELPKTHLLYYYSESKQKLIYLLKKSNFWEPNSIQTLYSVAVLCPIKWNTLNISPLWESLVQVAAKGRFPNPFTI